MSRTKCIGYDTIKSEKKCIGNTAQTIENKKEKWYNISMNKQLTISLISDELAKAQTSKKEFLEKIERIIPLDEWIEIIRPYYIQRRARKQAL